MLTEDQIDEFETTLELNAAYSWQDKARFRVNVFQQQMYPAMVIRHIKNQVPTLESLGLPKVYNTQIMKKRGLILLVGQTGCGKSTSLAAMIEHRNEHGNGHIITIEDPIEFLHQHKNCIVSQRDVGIDTFSFGMALKNTLRQNPDVILIGEIRDRETMEHAITFAETGHLCLATLHANNANQAIERILNFFPEEMHRQILLNLSMNLRAIFSQRLVTNVRSKRSLAIEILLNEGVVKEYIQSGRIKEIREIMERNREHGMQTFDQALVELQVEGLITEETAIAESDNPSNVRLALKKHKIDNQIASGGELSASEF
jgi:twitching motility protein PilU